MSDTNDGGPAKDMSVRDFFAGCAMAGEIARDPHATAESIIRRLSDAAYRVAEHMVRVKLARDAAERGCDEPQTG